MALKKNEEFQKRVNKIQKKKEFQLEDEVVQSQEDTKIRKILRVVEYTVLVLGIAFLTYILINTANGKAVGVFGKKILHVTTGSMKPTIEEGAYVLTEKCNPDNLKEKDIVAYYSEASDVYGQVVIHRIIKIREDGTFVMKGDANPDADRLSVRKDQIIGKYDSEIWFLNWLTSFADTKKLMLIVVVLPLFFVSAYEFSTVTRLVYHIKSESYQEKLKKEGIETAQEKIERLKREAVEEYLRQQSGAGKDVAEKTAEQPGAEADTTGTDSTKTNITETNVTVTNATEKADDVNGKKR